MAEDPHLRVQAILEAAVRLPLSRREAFIEAACDSSRAMMDEVRSLLPHYEQVQSFEPDRGPDWFFPGTTTITRVRSEAASAEMDARERQDPVPPFSIGDFDCDKVLGYGGMGVVYRAFHRQHERYYAIKLLGGRLLSSDDRWRFAFEAELLRRLRHPGIAQVFEVNETQWASGTQPYFVMELIQGSPLTQYADSAGLNALDRVALLAEVCNGIAFAHRRGIVHRDLKPGNILVDRSGHPKVLDFGIARIQGFTPFAGGDAPGRFVGTLAYASPEQLAGSSSEISARTDVYALGLIMHELLSGTLPRRTSGRLQLDLNCIRLDGCPETLLDRKRAFRRFLRVVFCRALTNSPGKRYGCAGELGEALTAIVAEFHRQTGWSAIRERFMRLLTGERAPVADGTNRPLAAVLRKRIAMSMKSEPLQEEDESEEETSEDSGEGFPFVDDDAGTSDRES